MLKSTKLQLISAVAGAATAAFAAYGEPFPERVRELRTTGAELAEDGDVEGAAREFEANLALQPGHAGLLAHLAVLELERGAVDAAVARMNAVADLGATANVEVLRDALGDAAERPDAAAALARIAANAEPVGEAYLFAEVMDPDLLVEGVAVAADGDIFVSTIVGRRILAARIGGEFEVFADETDDLFSVSGVGIDDANGLLWAATRGFPQTPLGDGEAATTALVAFDVETGETRARFAPAEEGAGLADLTVAPSGAVYVSDPDGRRIYRADGPDGGFGVFAASDALMSPQGLAVVGDRLYVADYGRGLFAAGIEDGVLRAVAAPETASLIGVDGLAATPNGDLIAIQNGFRPNRIVRLKLSEDGLSVVAVEVLAAALPEFDEPTLGQVVDGRFVFVANSQWPSFPEADETGADDADGPAPERQPVRIMAIPLDDI